MLAYSLFAVATLHALLISMVDAGCTRTRRGRPLDAAAPHARGARLRLTAAAFGVLTLTLLVGVAYSESLLGKALRFDHKTLFVVLSWLTFGALLVGRWLYGWRGRTALRWTLTGS